MKIDKSFNLELEQSLLGSMLTNDDAIEDVIEYLDEEDFFIKSHKTIFKTIINQYSNQKSITLLLISDKLSEKGKLTLVGGKEYLIELQNLGYKYYNARSYAEAIKKYSIGRKLYSLSDIIKEKAFDTDNQVNVLDEIQKNIFDISNETTKSDLVHAKDIIGDITEELKLRQENKEHYLGIETKFVDLDAKINGLQKANLVLIAARPSMGKTSFGMNIVENIGIRTDKNICVFSLEMAKEQLMMRMLSSTSGVDLKNVLTGNLSIEEWKRLSHAAKNLSDSNIYIDDSSGLNIVQLRSKLRRYSLRHKKVDLVLIDYLQLMSGVGRSENRQLEISNISRGLKEVAKELNCPVVALSQLSREPEKRANHRPMLSDLRESGAIEQDADLVMFIYRGEVYNEEGVHPKDAEIIIAKQRNGETGTVHLTWLNHLTKFVNTKFEN